jgi:SAM-dependent methyltransferase
MLKASQDAFGQMIRARFMGQHPHEVVERDDGYIDVSGGAETYFSEYRDWLGYERRAMRYVRGRVLDVGCGAGRHCLYLQRKGFDVVGIDPSPLAVTVCKLRRVRRCLNLSLVEALARPRRFEERFDTILMMGNNFGLFESFDRVRSRLRRFYGITNPGARIIASTRDPYDTDRPEHLTYHRSNRGRGRMGGQVRIRVRYRRYATPWFDYLMVSRKEARAIVNGTGWQLATIVGGPDGMYIAVIERVSTPAV